MASRLNLSHGAASTMQSPFARQAPGTVGGTPGNTSGANQSFLGTSRLGGNDRSFLGSEYNTGGIGNANAMQTTTGTAHVPVAGVATAEQLAALDEAARLVDVRHTHDRRVSDLYAALSRSGRVSGEYSTPDRPSYYTLGTIPLPDALLEQYRHLECKCFMGLFPEINRAWFTMDNKLFLWNYADQSDFYEYDGLDQIITSVSLVTPKPGVFVDDVRYLLVLATPVEVVILGVYFANGDVSDEVELIHTQLSVPSDQVNMLKVIGTPTGRIFMAGRDGSLFELAYQSEETWLKSRCTKINHTSSAAYRMVPSFLKWSGEDPLIHLDYDPTRHVLYTLSEQGVITCYDCGAKGDALVRVAEARNLTRTAQGLAQNRLSLQGGKLSITTITHVPVEEGSSSVHLIAFTTQGDRLYFTTSRGYTFTSVNALTRPKTLELIHIRTAPSRASTATANANTAGSRTAGGGNSTFAASSPNGHLSTNASSHHDFYTPRNTTATGSLSMYGNDTNTTINSSLPPDVGCAFYRRGCALMADASSDSYDRLVSIAPDPALMFPSNHSYSQYSGSSYGSGGTPLVETATSLDIQGKVWDICEVSYPDPTDELISTSVADGTTTTTSGAVAPHDLLVLNELVTQHRSEVREFLLLTATGIVRIAKTRPVDVLNQILEQARGQETQWLHYFFQRFGIDQACAMSLHLACAPVSSAIGYLPALPSSPTKHGAGGLSSSAPAPASPGTRQSRDTNVQLYAKHSFFHFGGMPYFDQAHAATAQGSSLNLDVGRAVTSPNLVFSGCHDGIALFLSRVIHPAWSLTITTTPKQGRLAGIARTITGGNTTQQLRSPEIWRRMQAQLNGIRAFFDEHPSFAAPPAADINDQYSRNTNQRMLDMQRRQSRAEAKRMEQRSLHDLSQLVTRSLEAISFLNVLYHHDFPKLIAEIPADMQERLAHLTFRQLVVSPEGIEVSRCLVAVMINKSYISAQQSVDSITEHLTQTCGAFFGAADLVRYKGYELLEKAKITTDPIDRHRLLEESLVRFCKIAEHIQLDSLCAEYQYLHFYSGIIELGLCRAQALDPQDYALDYQPEAEDAFDHQNHLTQSTNDLGGPSSKDRRHFFDLRVACYQTILNSFHELVVAPEQIALPSPDDVIPASARPRLEPSERERVKSQALSKAISSSDRLFHLSLYQWHINNGLTDLLLEYQSPYLEDFLRQSYARAMQLVMQGETGNLPVTTASALNLLWQYYVRNQKFAAAVHILSKLAESRGRVFDLPERIRYLSLAIGNCKSTGSSTDVDGEKLHDLKAKMDVAHVQLKLYHELQDKLGRIQHDAENHEQINAIQEAIGQLEQELFTISILYNQYAAKFQLWESALAILHCAAHDDREVIYQIWENLIETEVQSAGMSGMTTTNMSMNASLNSSALHHAQQSRGVRPEAIATKVTSLARIYYPAAEYIFPVPHIAGLLEKINYNAYAAGRRPANSADLLWVVSVFDTVGVPTATLFTVYDSLYQVRSGVWADLDAQLHLLSVIALILKDWIDHVRRPQSTKHDRQQFMSKNVADALDRYVVDLQTAGPRHARGAALLEDFRHLQTMITSI